MKAYTIQTKPFKVPASDGKLIMEHFGKATVGNNAVSIAYMVASPGWCEPFQKPEFDEYTFIIKGKKQLIIEGESIILKKGQSIKIQKHSRVQYANPFDEPCEYLAVCTPAFTLESANREEN